VILTDHQCPVLQSSVLLHNNFKEDLPKQRLGLSLLLKKQDEKIYLVDGTMLDACDRSIINGVDNFLRITIDYIDKDSALGKKGKAKLCQEGKDT